MAQGNFTGDLLHILQDLLRTLFLCAVKNIICEHRSSIPVTLIRNADFHVQKVDCRKTLRPLRYRRHRTARRQRIDGLPRLIHLHRMHQCFLTLQQNEAKVRNTVLLIVRCQHIHAAAVRTGILPQRCQYFPGNIEKVTLLLKVVLQQFQCRTVFFKISLRSCGATMNPAHLTHHITLKKRILQIQRILRAKNLIVGRIQHMKHRPGND